MPVERFDIRISGVGQGDILNIVISTFLFLK